MPFLDRFTLPTRAAAALIAGLALPGLAAAQTSQPLSSTDAEVVIETAKITAVDPATRMITLQAETGATATIHAGDEVRNFAQIKVGDTLVAREERAINFKVLPPGSKIPDNAVVTGVARAKPGQKPAAGAGAVGTKTVIITGVDVASKTVTIVEPGGGNEHTLQVRNPERQAMLPQVHPGDLLVITYSEAVTLQVVPPAQ